MNGRLNGFFCELKRRKVYRVAAAYAVVGWLLIQIAATIFPPLELPAWTLRFVVISVLAGFPVALVLAWAFDIGPRGIEITGPAFAEDCPPALRPKGRNIYLLGAAGVVIAVAVGMVLWPRTAGRTTEKSIAVLPFDNLSNDPENAFFADGLHDDVLTSLANVGDLKVISRTSVLPYRGKGHNMREIGKALGVGAILEGSVRRSGSRIRLVVQLIDARTDQHLWAEDYDRDLTDVFAIQSALAQEIAHQLKAKLSPDEKARMETKPTQNNDAYLLYVRARTLATGSNTEERKNAIPLFEQALQLDPDFAVAHAQLSRLQSWIYFSIDPTPARREQARASLDHAMRLNPSLAETRLAIGFFRYYCERDYDGALKEFNAAREALPNDAEVIRFIGAIQRRLGDWERSTKSYRSSVARNPNDAVLLRNLALNYVATRDFPRAARTFDKAIALAPHDFEIKSLRAWVDVYANGDFKRFHSLLAESPDGPNTSPVAALARFNVQFFERKFDEAVASLAKTPFENMRGETSAPLPKAFLAAQAHRAKGDADQARLAYEQALPIAERALADSPGDAARHALVGLIYAGLGRNDEAVAAGRRAVEMLPETKDAFNGPILVVSLSRILTMTGAHDEAVALLQKSLVTPAGITLNELRLDPTWDALRAHPGFQRLIVDAAGPR